MFHAHSIDRSTLPQRPADGAAGPPRLWTSLALSTSAVGLFVWVIIAAWVVASDLFAWATGYVAVVVPRVRFLICNYDERNAVPSGIGFLLLTAGITHAIRLARHARRAPIRS